MLIKRLDVILRKKGGRIQAIARQMTPEGLKEGTNILRGKRPRTCDEAMALVRLQLGAAVSHIEFIIEQKDWERNQ
jgi:hypothetical protein